MKLTITDASPSLKKVTKGEEDVGQLEVVGGSWVFTPWDDCPSLDRHELQVLANALYELNQKPGSE